LDRVNNGLGLAIKGGIPKEAAALTLMVMEMQILENRVLALEKKK